MKRYSIYIPAKLMARIKPVEAPDGEYVLYEDAKEMEDMLRRIRDGWQGSANDYDYIELCELLNKVTIGTSE